MTRIRALLRPLAAVSTTLAAVTAFAAAFGGPSAYAGTGPADTGPASADSGIAVSVARTPTTTTYDTLHWVGYTFPVKHVTAVRAEWTEPKVTGKKGDQEFVWLGIGGWGSKDDNIIQEGTFAYFPSNKQRNEGVWYELVPKEFAKYAGVAVKPGNHINASITLLSARKHTWRLALADTTTGARFTKTLAFKSLEEYPDFVVEDPDKGNVGANGPFFPFPRWTPVTFTHIGIKVGNRWLSAAQVSRYRINMVRSGKTLATAGRMSKYSGFTATDR
jgi:Peptidase A4 family